MLQNEPDAIDRLYRPGAYGAGAPPLSTPPDADFPAIHRGRGVKCGSFAKPKRAPDGNQKKTIFIRHLLGYDDVMTEYRFEIRQGRNL